MSKNLEKVVQRAISDAAFRRQLQTNPEGALRGFKLTQDEVAALRSGDAGKLTSLGIDQRMSKVFTFGADGAVSRASVQGDLAATNASVDMESAARGARLVIPGEGNDPAAVNDPARGDPMAAVTTPGASAASIVRDPENPAYSRYIGDQAASSSDASASIVRDPENPAYSRFTGESAAAPTSDAIEDQSHGFAASRSADVAGSGMAAPIEGTPEWRARLEFGDQASSGAAIVRDPENPAYARYTGDSGAAPTSDAIEDQSHGFAAGRSADVAGSGMAAPIEGSPEEFAFRDQAAGNAALIRDPENPAYARYTGDQGAAPTSDAIEDQSHAFSAGRSADDAFLSSGEASQYAVDPNASSDQAEDISHAFNPADPTAALPDDAGDQAAGHRGPDVPV